jgi:hypothetical protein
MLRLAFGDRPGPGFKLVVSTVTFSAVGASEGSESLGLRAIGAAQLELHLVKSRVKLEPVRLGRASPHEHAPCLGHAETLVSCQARLVRPCLSGSPLEPG